MAYKYLYIDDESFEVTAAYSRQIVEQVGTDKLIIKHLPTKPWDELQKALAKMEYDGIIVDLKLNQFSFWFDEEHKWDKNDIKTKGKAKYTGIELAQLLRTLGTEGKLSDLPILLWSTERRIQTSAFSRDKTSHDLFDLKTIKQDLEESGNAKDVGIKMISLAKGYKELLNIRTKVGGKNQFFKFLGWKDDPDFFDPRLLGYFNEYKKPIPLHEYARFFLRKLLEVSGPLIDKYTLAARLGLDIDKSKDFNKLLEVLPKKAKYNGPFKEGWHRWWGYQIEEWWSTRKDNPGPLKMVKAEERIQYLKKKTNLKKLSPFKPERNSYSTKYWTICQAKKTPLSPLDGFLIDFQHKLPWQSSLYISMEAIEQRLLKENKFFIDPLEKSRLDEEKKRRKSE